VNAASHNLDRVRVGFDAPGLVANAGLVLPATLAQHLGLPALLRHHVRLGQVEGSANPGVKAMTAIASLLSGGSGWTTSTRCGPPGWEPRCWAWRRRRHRR
jgi:hypothetical protein